MDGDDPAAHTALGAAYVIRGENELAVDALQTAIRLNPSSARAFSFLGHALTQSNRFEEAITSHKNAIELGARDPVLPNYMGRLGSCYLQTGQYELALEWTRRATRRLGANIWIAYAQMACALVGLERLDEAREAVNQLAQANPKITAAYIDEVWTPFFGPEVAARFIEQLCNAGLLES